MVESKLKVFFWDSKVITSDVSGISSEKRRKPKKSISWRE